MAGGGFFSLDDLRGRTGLCAVFSRFIYWLHLFILPRPAHRAAH